MNLLLANQKNSRDPGDNKQMISARRQFLDQGYYASLASTLAHQIQRYGQGKTLQLYDAGCGEGYYLQQVADSLRGQGLMVAGWGSDLSKSAIQMAAKRYPGNQFAVASSFKLPVAPQSMDVLLQVFAPGSSTEVHRVLAPDGLWLQVTPGPMHLFELKTQLYNVPEQHEAGSPHPDGFTLEDSSALTFTLELPQLASREQLLQMTPYYWSTGAENRRAILDNMGKLTVDFSIRVLRKKTLNKKRDQIPDLFLASLPSRQA